MIQPYCVMSVRSRSLCDRPSVELYTLLSVTSSKALMITCTECRRKGTLAHQLAEANITLSSMHTQVNIYKRLLNSMNGNNWYSV